MSPRRKIELDPSGADAQTAASLQPLPILPCSSDDSFSLIERVQGFLDRYQPKLREDMHDAPRADENAADVEF